MEMTPRLAGKTVVMIAANEFEDIELLYRYSASAKRGLKSSSCRCRWASIPVPASKGNP